MDRPAMKQNVFSVAVVGPKIPHAGGTVSYHTQAKKRYKNFSVLSFQYLIFCSSQYCIGPRV